MIVEDAIKIASMKVPPAYDSLNFKFNISQGAKIEEQFHYHYHYHYNDHQHSVSIINLGEAPWFLETPWNAKDKTVTVEVEIDVTKEQMDKIGGKKLKVNVTVPVQYAQQLFKSPDDLKRFLERSTQQPAQKNTTGQQKPQKPVENLNFPVYTQEGNLSYYRILAIPLNINESRSVPADDNVNFEYQYSQGQQNIGNTTHNLTFATVVKESENATINNESVVIHYHIHQHVIFNVHNILVSKKFIIKNESAAVKDEAFPTIVPGAGNQTGYLFVPGKMTVHHPVNAQVHY